MQQRYSPAEYWESRLARHVDITTVGDIRLGRTYNEWLYRARFRALRRAIWTSHIKCEGKCLLEVGVGSGAYIPFWQVMGIKEYVGVDITNASITALRNRYPGWKFVRADICDITTPDKFSKYTQDGLFDMVTLFDVLFHIVDDEAFSRAIANVSRLVRAGGYVLISDSFCGEPWGPFFHEYHRTRGEYAQRLHCNGLQIVHIEPIFIIMTAPLYSSSRGRDKLAEKLIDRALKMVSRLARSKATDWLNHCFGATLYSVNALLLRGNKSGRSLKFLVARHDS